MLGAIAGDIIGSVFEWGGIKTKDFPLFSEKSQFTDDTVLTVAVADVLLHAGDYSDTFRRYARDYPSAGYGGMFLKWAFREDAAPYNSFGNGSAMRVAAVGWAFDDMETVLAEAKKSASATHSHPEGIKGAQATAASILMARQGADKEAIRRFVAERFHYDMDRSLDDIRPAYGFDVTCQGSVPEAIIAFCESVSYEDCIRNAISLGGDADTQAAIAGGIAEAFHGGVPLPIKNEVFVRLDERLRTVTEAFMARYGPSGKTNQWFSFGQTKAEAKG